MIDGRAPLIVGTGQVLARDIELEASCEPLALIAAALRAAGEDSGTGTRLLRRADSVRCVPVIGWHYPNAALLVAEELGAHPRETAQSATIGGEGPQLLVSETARAIAAGEIDVALLGGAEAGASLHAAARDGRTPSWRRQREGGSPPRIFGTERGGTTQAEAGCGLAAPVHMYALIESALRSTGERSPAAHTEHIARLWSRFSEIAASNPYAWIKRVYSPAEIATPTPANRLVSTPYTKLLTANIQVNMASGLILASADAARLAGVPSERWVFIHAGAQALEEWHVSERAELAAAHAISTAGRALLGHAAIAIDEVAHVDLYSCFPSAVEIAARELGLSIGDRACAPSVTGGLTFAGGPGNNYSSHAIATLVHRLREAPDSYGLASAVGWYMTKHALGLYGGRPPRRTYASLHPQPSHPPARRARTDYRGAAAIEGYTVAYARDACPEAAIISALTPRGERVLVRSAQEEVIDALAGDDGVGWPISVGAEQRVAIESS
jgi:acetyl-CoA C-acetyltransferase